MSTHTISLVNRCFYPRSFVVKALQSIIKVQARFKQLFHKIRYRSIEAQNILTFKHLPRSKVFISSLSSPLNPSAMVVI